MSRAEQREYVQAMLVRLRDSMEQASFGISREANGARMLMFPRSFNQAMRELYRCLEELRCEPVLRWHVVAFYVDVEYRRVPHYRYVTKQGGKRARIPNGFTLEAKHDPRWKAKASEGVDWIVQHFAWDRVHLKAILEASGRAQAA